MSDQAEFRRQLEENRQAYERLRDEIRQKYAGRFVALGFGKVLASGRSTREVEEQVRALEPRPLHYEIFPAGVEPLFDTISSTSVEYS
jgi:hypothetical protein